MLRERRGLEAHRARLRLLRHDDADASRWEALDRLADPVEVVGMGVRPGERLDGIVDSLPAFVGHERGVLVDTVDLDIATIDEEPPAIGQRDRDGLTFARAGDEDVQVPPIEDRREGLYDDRHGDPARYRRIRVTSASLSGRAAIDSSAATSPVGVPATSTNAPATGGTPRERALQSPLVRS